MNKAIPDGPVAFIALDKSVKVKVSPMELGRRDFQPYHIDFAEGIYVPKDEKELKVLTIRARATKDVAALSLGELQKAVAALAPKTAAIPKPKTKKEK